MNELIIPLIGTFTAVFTVALTNFLSKRNLLKLEERKIKQEYYIQFLKTLSDSMNDNKSDEVVIAHNHAYNNLMLIASPKVISAIIDYKELVISYIKGKSIENYGELHDQCLARCFKAMRVDLYGKGREINEGYPDQITFLSGVIRKNS